MFSNVCLASLVLCLVCVVAVFLFTARSETIGLQPRNLILANRLINYRKQFYWSSGVQIRIMEGTKGKKRVAENSSVGRKAKQQKVETTKGKKAKKEKSDVKRASSAYIFFSNDFRKKLKAKSEKSGEAVPKVNEIAKLAGAEWKQMTPEQKKPYEELARKDKERYQAETGKSVVKQDSDKPKRNPTAYFLFLADFRKKMANEKLPEGQKVPTLAGEKWRKMTDKDKEPYLKEEAKQKAKYEEAMKEYRKKVPQDAPKPKPKSKPKKKPEPEEDDDDEEEEEEEEEEEDESEEEYDDDDDDE